MKRFSGLRAERQIGWMLAVPFALMAFALLTVGASFQSVRAGSVSPESHHPHSNGEVPKRTAIADAAPPAAKTARPVAAATVRVLSGGGPHPAPELRASLLGLDMSLVELDTLVAGPTFLFYFSAGCPHCQAVAPELERLAQRLEGAVRVVGIGSGSNGLSELRAFVEDYKLSFPVYKDSTRRFASSNQITSTPVLLLVRPDPNGFETLATYRPFSTGHSLPAEIHARSLLGQDPFGAFEEDRYYGSVACGSCHEEEYKSWGLTHHSKAYWTLYEAKKLEDAKCVKCHVTGMGETTGYLMGDHQSPNTDVGCEACHGPGGPHGGPRMLAKDPTSLCVTCHDKEHSLRFDLERGLEGIDHFRSYGMSPEAFRTAREDMLEGRAAKPLIALPAGQNLGSSACKSCHPGPSRHWKNGPHAKAVATLKAKGSGEDPACLACHQRPVFSSNEGAALAPESGVGCEACHGPGEEHLAAKGGTENILGLGETCSPCVIEALCTTCHTAEEDPDWELERALKAIAHGKNARGGNGTKGDGLMR